MFHDIIIFSAIQSTSDNLKFQGGNTYDRLKMSSYENLKVRLVRLPTVENFICLR